jgi:hypothetical protein
MKLGIFAVYLLRENGGPLLRVHLDRIARHTRSPYTLYAAPLRLAPQFRQTLQDEPKVRIVDIPPVEQAHIGREHAHYLDALVQAALADGVTHLCALHVDSFPIRDGWDIDLIRHVKGDCVGSAVLLAEDGQRVVPMPCGFLFSADFQRRFEPRFYPPPQVEQTDDYQRFAREYCHELDSGIGYAYVLHQQGLGCHRLLRSNRRNDHYIIAGVYGDTFFHLGAANRKHLRYRGDFLGAGVSSMLRLRQTVDQKMTGVAQRWLGRLLPNRNALLQQAEEHNRQAQQRVFQKLTADPEGYIAWLRGQPADQGPYIPVRRSAPGVLP